MLEKAKEKIAVFYFSCIPYDGLYQRPQQLFREWRSHFDDSFDFYYVDFPQFTHAVAGVVQEVLQSIRKKDFNEAGETDSHVIKGCPYPPRGVRGHRLPQWTFENPFSFEICNSFILKALDKRCSRSQKRVAIVAAPFWEPFVSKNEFDLVCYDYLDAIDVSATFYSYSATKKQHEKLVRRSDVVFVTAEALKQATLAIASDKEVVVVSNGADSGFFASNRESHQILDYAKTKRKIVGYIGALGSWFDLDLVYAAAEELTEVDFVLVGPFDPKNKKYTKSKPKNVYMLGVKEYAQIPSYVNIFDVGLIPFQPGPISDATNPVKLYEYFSLGKPVVATFLRSLEEYDDGRLLKTAGTAHEFADAIKFFITQDSQKWQASREQISLQNSWLSKATTIIWTIESRLRERRTCEHKTL
jgi:glycosyltransferase involved in cell wall biosynthesis